MNYIEIIPAYQRLEDIKDLFTQYTSNLEIDLSYQNYDLELNTLPGLYAMPKGVLYIVLVNDKPAGCIALKPLNSTDCEMKRLFVNQEFRNLGLAKMLCQKLIAYAKAQGYSKMYLDTLDTLQPAIRLYNKLGFTSCLPYYDTPIKNIVFFELDLTK